jgi:multiple sugar transport system permease protein
MPIVGSRRRLQGREEPFFIGGSYAIAVAYALVILVPVYFVIVSSFKDTNEIYGSPLGLPNSFSLVKYVSAVRKADLLRAMGYSFGITAATEVLTLLLAFPAAYAIARIPTRLGPVSEIIFSFGFLVPAFAMLVPVYITMSSLGLLYDPLALIIFYPATMLSLSIILLASYMRDVPRELEESAELDGATRPQMMVHIFFPLARSGIATLLVLNFLHVWNEFLFALVLLSSKNRTVQVAATSLKAERVADFGLIAAGVVIISLPAFLVFALFQERIVVGLTAGATKG